MRWPAARMKRRGVRDTKVDADAIHRQNGLNLSVGVHKAGALLWGNLASCGRLAIGRTQRVPPAFAPDSGGTQPPRRLPACPTSCQRFHSYVVHQVLGGRLKGGTASVTVQGSFR